LSRNGLWVTLRSSRGMAGNDDIQMDAASSGSTASGEFEI
jgi:hypothetical protein